MHRYTVQHNVLSGRFTHFNPLTMYFSPLNRLLTAVVVCGLLLQGCGSGLRAITENFVLKQEPSTPDDHVQASGETLSSGSLASSRTDARISGMSGSVSPSELVTAVVPASPPFFAGPFTASSGERVLLRQQRGQWQALHQGGAGAMAHGRVLPVVSSGDIGALLSSLQGQDVWSSRSRIHVLAAPTPPNSPCVYVGKLGLLGGAPTSQAKSPEEAWLRGPAMVLGSNTTKKESYHIPPGYRFKGYRLKTGSVVQRARLTIHYVAANNEEAYRRLEAAQNSHAAAASLGANVGQVVTLGKIEGSVGHSAFTGHEVHDLKHTNYAGLVLYGSTRKNDALRPRSMINVQVEILMEKVEETSPVNSVSVDQEDTKPAAQDPSPSQAGSFATSQARQRLEDEAGQVAEGRARLSKAELAKLRKEASLSQTTLPAQAFGVKEWTQYFGEVGEEPSLPPDLDQILSSACPFWPDKQVKDTHLLVLIPAKVAGRPYHLNLLGELIQRPQGGGHATKYRYYDGGDVQKQFGAQSPTSSYWVLMTRDVLEGSRKKSYKDQKFLVAGHAKRDGLPYKLPGALEAATAILSHYVRSRERLYTDDPWTYTRCQELVDNRYPVSVGGFSSGGLGVSGSFYYDYHHYDGVASLRKF